MNLIWDNNLNTGVSNIDNQHKELFNRINLLLSAMKEGKGTHEAIKTLNFLEEYVIRHFNDEEEIQRKNNYPKYNIQHKQHEEFKNELKELRKVFETTGISSLFVINVQQKITSWWIKHIGESDKDLGKFLLEDVK
ncbi:bacteriohemerythrin [Clostridium sp.]|uniref:bacteriohemerythrin n=1 Tax=Clostridium sp. TaxID=1506 RepID=UPI0026093203|nr:bacteriohemerythrin [Clostridium sp.]